MNIYGRPIGKIPRQRALGKAKYVSGATKVSPPPKKKNKGGDVKAIKTVAAKLSKASKAHAGQSKVLKELYLNMFRLIKLFKNLLNLDYRVRRLERAKYWKEKYHGTKEKNIKN